MSRDSGQKGRSKGLSEGDCECGPSWAEHVSEPLLQGSLRGEPGFLLMEAGLRLASLASEPGRRPAAV